MRPFKLGHLLQPTEGTFFTILSRKWNWITEISSQWTSLFSFLSFTLYFVFQSAVYHSPAHILLVLTCHKYNPVPFDVPQGHSWHDPWLYLWLLLSLLPTLIPIQAPPVFLLFLEHVRNSLTHDHWNGSSFSNWTEASFYKSLRAHSLSTYGILSTS